MNKLYIMCGIPFSGKSTLSKLISSKKNITHIDLDEVKQDLLGDVMDDNVSQADWDKVYSEMYDRIENGLKQGDVIQDAGNFTKYERDLVKKVAEKTNSQAVVIYVDCPEELARRRWEENKNSKTRFDVSENSFTEAIKEMEPPTHDESLLTFTSSDNMDEWIERNFSQE